MAGKSGEEDHVVLSMVDVLEEDNALEEEANAVLGASDDQNCTYPQGYVDRQALYSCLTCSSSEESLAGICFACSLYCHDGHDLVELYTKRNFRCDCGNSKFNGFQCKLFSEKSKQNELNVYNQNFQGKYCTCKRPYPDPEDEIEDEMIQCIICEDWYHSRHLGTLAPADYQEMICDGCMQKLDFLRWYKSVSVPSQDTTPSKGTTTQDAVSEQNGEGKGKMSTLKVTENTSSVSAINSQFLNDEKQEEKSQNVEVEEKPVIEETHSADCIQATKTEEGETTRPTDSTKCKLENLKTGNEGLDMTAPLKASFWPNHWRRLLCTCSDCKDVYSAKRVCFITNENDTVSAYEEKGKRKQENNTAYDKGMRAFSAMNRINQVEVLTEYNDMKSELHEFLKTFAGEGKVVTKEDIEDFFAGMKAKKRRRLEDGASLRYHCK